MKVRDLVRYLSDHGCQPVRQNGSHQIWLLPNGKTIPVVINHLNAEASRNVMGSIRRELRAAGIPPP